MWDIAVIGAGLSGLICARQLRAAGYQVCVIDKSRGLGGRMATRRVTGLVRVDHGLRYWQNDAAIAPLTEELISAGVLTAWPANSYTLVADGQVEPLSQPQPVYIAPDGMSAVAKYLAQGLIPDETLLTQSKVTRLTLESQPHESGWRIDCEDNKVIMARQCAIAIPAPQAAELLAQTFATLDPSAAEKAGGEPSGLDTLMSQLKAVTYDPCLTVLAGYNKLAQVDSIDPNGWRITDTIGTSTRWVGLDSSKREAPAETTIVIHSKPDFARRYLELGDLQPAASVLLRANARKYGDWIAQPNWFQIHRWRYAFVHEPCLQPFLALGSSLVCGGDWCIDPSVMAQSERSDPLTAVPIQPITAAYQSGLAMANRLQTK